jgi:hypothetical protein
MSDLYVQFEISMQICLSRIGYLVCLLAGGQSCTQQQSYNLLLR